MLSCAVKAVCGSDRRRARGYAEGMREVFKGFLMLRLLAFIPLAIVIVVLVGVTALKGGSDVLGIAILAAVPVIVVAALGVLLARLQ